MRKKFVIALLAVNLVNVGYFFGKRAGDRWYAAHPRILDLVIDAPYTAVTGNSFYGNLRVSDKAVGVNILSNVFLMPQDSPSAIQVGPPQIQKEPPASLPDTPYAVPRGQPEREIPWPKCDSCIVARK